MTNIGDPPKTKQVTLMNSRFQFGAPAPPADSASSRPAKRYKSVDDENPSPDPPQTAPHKRTMAFAADPSPHKRALFGANLIIGPPLSTSNAPVAPMAPMAPMAQMDTTPPKIVEPPAADIKQSVEEPAPAATPPTSLIGRMFNVFTGPRASVDVSPTRNVAVARKRSIDETEGSPTRQVAAKKARSQDIAQEPAAEVNDEIKDTAKPAEVPEERETSSSVAERERSVSLGNDTEMAVEQPAPEPAAIPAPSAEEASATPVPKAKAKAKAKPTPAKPPPATTPGRRARKSNVGASAKKETESKAENKQPEVPEDEDAKQGEEPADGEFEIEKLIGHRLNAEDPTLLDVHVSWKTSDPAGELTWEPEANVQEDAPGVLFGYWRTVKGGRDSALKNPEMWHVLGVKNHRVTKTTGVVSLHVAWIGSPDRSWEPEDKVAGYAKEHVEEYWASKGGRSAVLGEAVAPTQSKKRGRPAKSSAAAKTSAGPAKAPPKKTTARAKAAAAPAASTRATRSSRR